MFQPSKIKNVIWSRTNGPCSPFEASLIIEGQQFKLFHEGWQSNGNTKYFYINFEIEGLYLSQQPDGMTINTIGAKLGKEVHEHLSAFDVFISDCDASLIADAVAQEFHLTQSTQSAKDLYYGN